MRDILADLDRWQFEGKPIALATVVQTWGSSPRRIGSKMVVTSDRQFSGWYINLQDPIRRQERGFDTLDHELDYWLSASGSWSVKDDELFDQRVAEGRYSEQQATSIRATGSQVVDMLRTGSHWWDESWANWSPPSRWRALDLPDGWQTPTVKTLES